MKNLSEIADEEKEGSKNDGSDIKEAISSLHKMIEDRDNSSIERFISVINEIPQMLSSIEKVLQSILERPDPVFPEQKEFPLFPEFPKAEKFPEMPVSVDTSPLLQELIEAIHNEHASTREAIANIPTPERIETPLETEELKKAKSAGGAVRRTAQWNIFTYPNQPGTRKISNPSGDGLTWYLDNALISNSETIRLNGATPLSQGVDYAFNGNKIVFVQNQSGSQIEVRGQNR